MNMISAVAIGIFSAMSCWSDGPAQEVRPAPETYTYANIAVGINLVLDPAWKVEAAKRDAAAARERVGFGYSTTALFEATLIERAPTDEDDILPPLLRAYIVKPKIGDPDPIKHLTDFEKTLGLSPAPIVVVEEAANRQELAGVKFGVDIVKFDVVEYHVWIATYATTYKGQLLVFALRYSDPDDLKLLKNALAKVKYD